MPRQAALSAYNRQHSDQPIRVRMGLHTGEAIKEGDDFYGRSVVLASRIAGQGVQVLVSALLKELRGVPTTSPLARTGRWSGNRPLTSGAVLASN
jgi:class 3 adenylate cyclase